MAEKYDYLYSREELGEMAHRARAFAGKVRRLAVTFNNNREDYPVVTRSISSDCLGWRRRR